MNNDLAATNTLISELIKKEKKANAEVIIAPTFVNLLEASKRLKDSSIKVAAQNMHFANHGAYTGEISATMLKSVGVNTVILGHSERREFFSEDDNLLKQKIDKALDSFYWYDRDVFKLYYYEGHTLTGLAKKTGISRNSLFTTIDKVREQLKELLDE